MTWRSYSTQKSVSQSQSSLVFIQKVIISSTDLDRNIVSSNLVVLVCIRSDAKYLESLLEVQDYLVELLDLLD